MPEFAVSSLVPSMAIVSLTSNHLACSFRNGHAELVCAIGHIPRMYVSFSEYDLASSYLSFAEVV